MIWKKILSERKSQIHTSYKEIEYLIKKGYVKVNSIPRFFGDVISSIDQSNETLLNILNRIKKVEYSGEYYFDQLDRSKITIDPKDELVYSLNITNNLAARNMCSILNVYDVFNLKPIVEIRASEDFNLLIKLSTSNIIL